MDALLQRFEIQPVVGGDDDGHRPLVAAAQLDLIAISKTYGPESVPLGSWEAPVGIDAIDLAQHRRNRRHDGQLDDHSRYPLSVTAHRRVTGPIVLAAFRKTCAAHGIPASTLTDNGMVFMTRLAGGKGGRNPEQRMRALTRTDQDSVQSGDISTMPTFKRLSEHYRVRRRHGAYS